MVAVERKRKEGRWGTGQKVRELEGARDALLASESQLVEGLAVRAVIKMQDQGSEKVLRNEQNNFLRQTPPSVSLCRSCESRKLAKGA